MIIEIREGQYLSSAGEQFEKQYIESTLEHMNGSRERTASVLGVSMATLFRKLERYGLLENKS